MSDVIIRRDRKAGRITLNRPQALNALTWGMVTDIAQALNAWVNDPAVSLVMIDASGEKAFCAGGDLAEIYASVQRGDLEYARGFWRDEYRLNAQINAYPKPVLSFMHGFTMGGGVGIGCHASHRIVTASSRIALPECSIGLIPDVGATFLLARAPGHLGEYLGLTGARMGAGDAIFAGFADFAVPSDLWPDLIDRLCQTGDPALIPHDPPPPSPMSAHHHQTDTAFAAPSLGAVIAHAPVDAVSALTRNAPLAMTAALYLIRQQRAGPDMASALAHEYRYTHRAVAQGDFIEGIRAAIIDKDRKPSWRPATWADVTKAEVARMIAPLGAETFTLEFTP